MLLRNELLPGCGAPVRKQTSAGWPPSTLGWETPLKTVKSFRCASRYLRYGEGVEPRPESVGKNWSPKTPRLLQTANMRRGLPSGARGLAGADAARANLGSI